VPSSPQVEAAVVVQAPSRGFTPLGTDAQVPTAPGTSQALQVSRHAVAQQTPSTQNPLAQSPSQPHAVPSALRVPPPSPRVPPPSPLPLQATRSPPASFGGVPLPPPQPAMTKSSPRNPKNLATAATLAPALSGIPGSQ
jgi:hypothetical protein